MTVWFVLSGTGLYDHFGNGWLAKIVSQAQRYCGSCLNYRRELFRKRSKNKMARAGSEKSTRGVSWPVNAETFGGKAYPCAVASALNRDERTFYCVDQALPGERFVDPGAHALLQMSQRGARFAGFGGNNYDGQARCRRGRPHCTD